MLAAMRMLFMACMSKFFINDFTSSSVEELKQKSLPDHIIRAEFFGFLHHRLTIVRGGDDASRTIFERGDFLMDEEIINRFDLSQEFGLNSLSSVETEKML